jgi:hypothetical protein
MNGGDIKKAVVNKGKQMASVGSAAANGNGGKKRRKGTDLKPIVTNETSSMADSSTGSTSSQGYVFPSIVRYHVEMEQCIPRRSHIRSIENQRADALMIRIQRSGRIPPLSSESRVWHSPLSFRIVVVRGGTGNDRR